MRILKHESLQEVKLFHPLARAVFRKGPSAKAKEDLGDAQEGGVGAKVFGAGLGGK